MRGPDKLTTRRLFLKGAAALVGVLALPRALLAAWPDKAFSSKKTEDALQALFGTTDHTASDAVALTAPDIAENGAVVPITVATTLEGAKSISIIVQENPTPLVASFGLGPSAVANVSTRIKMGKTSSVIAVVEADGKLYSAQKEVKVTIGGCGG